MNVLELSPMPRQLPVSSSGRIHHSTVITFLVPDVNGAVTLAFSRPLKLSPFLLSALHTMSARSRVVLPEPASLLALSVTLYTPHTVGVRLLCWPLMT